LLKLFAFAVITDMLCT